MQQLLQQDGHESGISARSVGVAARDQLDNSYCAAASAVAAVGRPGLGGAEDLVWGALTTASTFLKLLLDAFCTFFATLMPILTDSIAFSGKYNEPSESGTVMVYLYTAERKPQNGIVCLFQKAICLPASFFYLSTLYICSVKRWQKFIHVRSTRLRDMGGELYWSRSVSIYITNTGIIRWRRSKWNSHVFWRYVPNTDC